MLATTSAAAPGVRLHSGTHQCRHRRTREKRHQNRSVGHGLTRNASRKTYVLSPTRMRLEVALGLEPLSLPRPEISRCPLVNIPLPLASEARMASSTFEAAAGLAGVPFAAAGRRLDAARGQRFGDFTQRHTAAFVGGVDREQHIGGVGIGARRARSGWPRRGRLPVLCAAPRKTAASRRKKANSRERQVRT